MRKITDGRLRLVLQPHAVYLSGFKNPRAPLKGTKFTKEGVDQSVDKL